MERGMCELSISFSSVQPSPTIMEDVPAIEVVSLGMFIIDTFSFMDSEGNPTGKVIPPQVRRYPHTFLTTGSPSSTCSTQSCPRRSAEGAYTELSEHGYGSLPSGWV
jgi:hypothetical protein